MSDITPAPKPPKAPAKAVAPKPKPIRVHTQQVMVAETCPVCTNAITGSAVLEIHMAPLAGGGVAGSVGVNVETTTKVRSFTVSHSCTPKAE